MADVVYSSHFIEHIPRNQVTVFLKECYRITKTGGYLRLVLPDWEEMCGTYLSLRRDGINHDKADFLMVEMLDQCVRGVSGGELGDFYARLQVQLEQDQNMINFVQQRTGHDFSAIVNDSFISRLLRLMENPQRISCMLSHWYISAILALLPSSFRRQNISFTALGEKHAWMYDFYTLKRLLLQAGFVDVQRVSAYSSNISDFPFNKLDVTSDGQPRKGVESMYVEALKP
jgi:ubiquinone/menaquinone biosynthesis C-methylase UbiE